MTLSLQNARQYHTQQMHYLRKNIAYTDAGTTVDVGVIPAGSLIIKHCSGVNVHVAFDGDATNTCSIGPSTDSGTDLWGSALSLASIDALVPLGEAVTMKVTVDTLVQAAIVSTASAAAGSGSVIICYIPDNG